MYEDNTKLCVPHQLVRNGPVDRLRNELDEAERRVTRLKNLLAKIDAQPAVAELLNEIGKEL